MSEVKTEKQKRLLAKLRVALELVKEVKNECPKGPREVWDAKAALEDSIEELDLSWEDYFHED